MPPCSDASPAIPRAIQNPFSTSRVRPGAIPYLFPGETSCLDIIQRWHRMKGSAQIVGPHGTGKSTLVRWLMRQLADTSKPAVLITLPGDYARDHAIARDVRGVEPGAILFIDGYEQLAWWRRRRLQAQCRRQNVRLTVTAHRSLGLPTLYRTHVTPALAQAVVERILSGSPCAGDWHIGPSEMGEVDANTLYSARQIARWLSAHRGDMRETLFSLYDTFEQSRRRSVCDSIARRSGGSGQLDSTVDQTGPV